MVNITEPMKHHPWSGYMDGYLKTNLDAGKSIIKHDWDMLFVIDGYEGTGKSVLAQQCAKYVDDTFDIDRICFSPKEFVQQINAAPKWAAVVYDEAYLGMSSRSVMTEVNKMLMGVLAEIRQKNLWVFIVLPCFFELDKYAAVWRSRGLLHVYTKENFERGHFSFYNQDRKKMLYVEGKKYFSYMKPSPNFFGRFTKGYVVDEQVYRQKKLDALTSKGERMKEPTERISFKHLIWLKDLIKEVAELKHTKEVDVCSQLGLNYTTYKGWNSSYGRVNRDDIVKGCAADNNKEDLTLL